MLWVDYHIKQNDNGDIIVEGDKAKEVMNKETPLYRPGDVFVVDQEGSSVYGDAKNIPVDEGCPQNPKTYYATGKLACEKYVNFFLEVTSISGLEYSANLLEKVFKKYFLKRIEYFFFWSSFNSFLYDPSV